MLEQVAAHDLDVAIPFGAPAPPPAPVTEAGAAATVTLEPVVNFVLDDLPRLLRRLVDGTDTAGFPQDVGQALFLTIPCLSLDVLSRARGEDAIRFTARADGQDGETAVVTRESTSGATIVRAAFASLRLADTYGPLLHTAASLVALSDGAGRNRSSREARPRQPTPSPPDPPTLDAEMRTLYADAAKVARGDVSVLITGESGTGKELIARAIHRLSPRRDGAFVKVNCAAIPAELVESELFGHEKGAFTGALVKRMGRIEQAHGGTLFLDEVSEMPPDLQVKFLRVLEERRVTPVGGNDSKEADFRLVSATNRDLKGDIAAGRFAPTPGWVCRSCDYRLLCPAQDR